MLCLFRTHKFVLPQYSSRDFKRLEAARMLIAILEKYSVLVSWILQLCLHILELSVHL